MTPEQIIARYHATYGRLRVAAVAQVIAAWVRFGGLSDEEADRFVAAAVPIVIGAQVATARLVIGYLGALVRAETGSAAETSIRPEDVSGDALRGVPLTDVYRRAVIAARAAVSEGKTPREALRLGRLRAEQLAETDVIMAQREAGRQTMAGDSRIVGYRRVLTGRSCALCATASTQRYRTDQLMPIHTRCDCAVAPIIGSTDPGRVINDRLVRDLKTAARQTGDRDAWRNRHVTVDEEGNVTLPEPATRIHGELGPVLTRRGDDFTGPDDLAA